MNNNRKLLGVTGLVVLALLLIFILKFGTGRKDDTIKIGFIMSGSTTEQGWNGMHYAGISEAANELGVELIVKENIAEFSGECEIKIKELVTEGAKMIVLSSYGYSEEVYELLKNYPDIVFYANSSEYHDSNLTSYFVRMYQARYLAGIIAGLRTTSDKIGYVAAMENNEVNRGINAFTLGVRRVNPDAEVVVNWSGAWDDEAAEKAAVKTLIIEENIDIVTYHQNQPNVIMAAEAAGIESVGYHIAAEDVSERMLTAVVCNWKLTYEELIKEFLQGNGNSKENYWIGLEAGVIGLSDYSTIVTKEQKDAVQAAVTEILSGKEVFSGLIKDNNGNIMCGEAESISDEVLLEQMNWFVEGVKIYEE